MVSAKCRAFGVAASLLIALPAYAASNSGQTTEPAQASKADNTQTAADRDFGKYSQDGSKAFDDIDTARIAIFDGDTAKAKQSIQDAQAMLTRAKSDDSVFMKAESELKVPAGTTQRGPNTAPSTTRVAWLPIGGAMALDEDFAANANKKSGVDKADEQIKQGNTKAAMDTLKLHDVNLTFVEDVVPLESTISGVQQAETLISQGHYFAANQALKTVEDGVRTDEQTYVATPEKRASN
jgi:hypothetical protein